MKPESHHALMELISYGMEELSNEDAVLLMSRIQECPECTGQWVLFQKTYTVLSQTGESEVSVERSQQMWLTCLEHAQHKPHTQHKTHAQAAHSVAKLQSEVVPVSFRSDSSKREEDRRNPHASLSPFAFLRQALMPRLPYALAAGAFALLATAYLAPVRPGVKTTQIASRPASQNLQNAILPLPTASQVRFAVPPRATTGMIDYHSEMGFEPFSDHLAPTLIADGVSAASALRP